MPPPCVWTRDMDETLERLWKTGLSAEKIGKQIGKSKNSVVGRCHRIKLPARPSPIKRNSEAPKATPSVTRPKFTLPPLPSEDQASGIARMVENGFKPTVIDKSMHIEVASVKLVAPRPVPVLVAVLRPEAIPQETQSVFKPRRSLACCWPIGVPGTKSFRYCDDPSMPGKPYCLEHAKLAYVRNLGNREVAA